MNEKTGVESAWLDDLMKKAVKNLGMKFEDVRYVVTNNDQLLCSNMLFVDVVPNASDEDNEKKKTIHLVVKRQPSKEMLFHVNLDLYFSNEILFYTEYAKGSEKFPRCIYTEKNPTKAVIVLENVVAERGYNLPERTYCISLDYMHAVCRAVAKFHANMYTMKEQRREEFFHIVKNLQAWWCSPTSPAVKVRDVCKTKATDYLRRMGRSDPILDEYHVQLEKRFFDMVTKFIEPEEPLATLCHGDLTMMNMLFKRENGELSTMFIDFATLLYSSPVVDLSLFLCLNCGSSLNRDMLNDALKVYHEHLTACLKQNGVDCGKYSYEAFHEEFKKKGLYGFTVASFYMGILMKEEGDWSPINSKETDVNVCIELTRQLGGDRINKILADLLLVLKEFGCLDYVVPPIDSNDDS